MIGIPVILLLIFPLLQNSIKLLQTLPEFNLQTFFYQFPGDTLIFFGEFGGHIVYVDQLNPKA